MIRSPRAIRRVFWGAFALVPALVACSLDSSGLSEPSRVAVNGSGGSGGSPATGSGGATVVAPGTGGQTVAGTGGGSATGGATGATGGAIGATGGATGSGGANTGSGGASTGTGGVPVVVGGAGGVSGTGGVPALGGRGGAVAAGGRGGTVAPPPPPPSVVGCADGTREAFVSTTRFPTVAGCSGGWSVAGVLTPASLLPACNRAAGNSGLRPGGVGCSVADLCGVGWHVCAGALELTALGVGCQSSGIATGGNADPLFFVTRQRGGPGTTCSPTDIVGINNLHGCGNFGLAEDVACMPPLDAQLSHTECADTPPWSCDDPTTTADEATVVTKAGSPAGGVLCCLGP